MIPDNYWFANVVHSGVSFNVYSDTNTETDDNWMSQEESWGHIKNYLTSFIDNTEGINAFVDIVIPDSAKVLLDIGSGKTDEPKEWVERRYPNITVFCVDPFNRSYQHNIRVQNYISTLGGADIVTSMSVVNCIKEQKDIICHFTLLHNVLKKQGVAYIKIWPGFWPVRGTGVSSYDSKNQCFQANRWASEYRADINTIFGHNNVIIDNNKNLIIAVKS